MILDAQREVGSLFYAKGRVKRDSWMRKPIKGAKEIIGCGMSRFIRIPGNFVVSTADYSIARAVGKFVHRQESSQTAAYHQETLPFIRFPREHQIKRRRCCGPTDSMANSRRPPLCLRFTAMGSGQATERPGRSAGIGAASARGLQSPVEGQTRAEPRFGTGYQTLPPRQRSQRHPCGLPVTRRRHFS